MADPTRAPTPAPQQRTVDRLSEVIVACKLPNGMRLSLQRPTEVTDSNGKTHKIYQPHGAEVVLNGWSHPQNMAPTCEIRRGFALTMRVSESFMREWMKQHQAHDAVKNGLIFYGDSRAEIDAQITDHEKVSGGLERLDPAKPARNIATADETKAEIDQRIALNEQQSNVALQGA